jgi:hypothetical protein
MKTKTLPAPIDNLGTSVTGTSAMQKTLRESPPGRSAPVSRAATQRKPQGLVRGEPFRRRIPGRLVLWLGATEKSPARTLRSPRFAPQIRLVGSLHVARWNERCPRLAGLRVERGCLPRDRGNTDEDMAGGTLDFAPGKLLLALQMLLAVRTGKLELVHNSVVSGPSGTVGCTLPAKPKKVNPCRQTPANCLSRIAKRPFQTKPIPAPSTNHAAAIMR